MFVQAFFGVPSDEEPHTSIARPVIAANNFELKPTLLQIVQQNLFSRNPMKDPNLHLYVFVQLADTLKNDGVNPEAMGLRLFPFSLRDRVRVWLQSLRFNFITTWNEFKKAFLTRYFSLSKTAQLKNQITCYQITCFRSYQISDWLPDVENGFSQLLHTRCEMLLTYNITFSYISWDPM